MVIKRAARSVGRYERRGRRRTRSYKHEYFRPPLLQNFILYADYRDIMPTERELGWLEGIIDGEGCLNFRRVPVTSPSQSGRYKSDHTWSGTLYVGNTDLRILKRAKAIAGGGSIRSMPRQNPNAKPCWAWRVHATHLRSLLPTIKLTGKERQRILLLEALALLLEHRGRSGQRHDSRLHEIWDEMRVLNRRGNGAGLISSGKVA